jgi:hypothetical protein
MPAAEKTSNSARALKEFLPRVRNQRAREGAEARVRSLPRQARATRGNSDFGAPGQDRGKTRQRDTEPPRGSRNDVGGDKAPEHRDKCFDPEVPGTRAHGKIRPDARLHRGLQAERVVFVVTVKTKASENKFFLVFGERASKFRKVLKSPRERSGANEFISPRAGEERARKQPQTKPKMKEDQEKS